VDVAGVEKVGKSFNCPAQFVESSLAYFIDIEHSFRGLNPYFKIDSGLTNHYRIIAQNSD